MKRIGTAIIGCGSIAETHASVLQQLDSVELCGAWNRTFESGKAFCQKYGIKQYASFQEVLDDPNVEVLVLLLPPSQHLEYALAAAAHNKKLIVEKPLAVEYAEAQQIVAAYRRAELPIAVIYQNRFTAAAQTIKQAMDEGRLGRLLMADAYIKWYRSPEYYQSRQWRGSAAAGGGVLMNQAIHTIDLLQWFVGGVHRIKGTVKTLAHDIDAEDVGLAIVEYNSGAFGVIEATTTSVPAVCERIELRGTKGTVVWERGRIVGWKVEGYDEDEYLTKSDVVSGKIGSSVPEHGNHLRQMREIFADFAANREHSVNGEEALKSLQIVCSIYAASAADASDASIEIS